jgi:hypothetical protein
MTRRAAALLLGSTLVGSGSLRAGVVPADPLVSVWYRGTPAGVPRQDDLVAIRALGFSGVTWPHMSTAAALALRQMAEVAGLTVVIRETPVPLTAASALAPPEYVDVDAAGTPAVEIAPVVWRAIAHGAHVISFDAGLPEGDGLRDRRGGTPGWVSPARAIARQVAFNGNLVAAFRRGPAVTTEAALPGLDLTVLDAGRPWVLVATNASRDRVRGVATLSPAIPYAPWVNLLDGSTMSMLNQSTGPKWRFDLEPWGVRVYVIDKTLK